MKRIMVLCGALLFLLFSCGGNQSGDAQNQGSSSAGSAQSKVVLTADRERSQGAEDTLAEATETTAVRASLEVEYAQLFSADPIGSSSWIVTNHKPWPDAEESIVYFLRSRDESAEITPPQGSIEIAIPLERAGSFDSATLEGVAQLKQLDRVVATDDYFFASHPDVVARQGTGEITQLAPGGTLNEEALLTVLPEAIFINVVNPSYDSREPLVRAGVVPITASAWLETHPLGRAEWIKFISLFFGEEERGAYQFQAVSESYESTALILQSVTARPTVITGFPFGSSWYIAGGESYLAQLIQDAGGSYVWSDLPGSGSTPMALEVAFERNSLGDIWIHAGWGWRTYDDLLAADPRFEPYSSVENRMVWHGEKGTSPETGANSYFSRASLRPQELLTDMASIFQPQLFPKYETIYFAPLTE